MTVFARYSSAGLLWLALLQAGFSQEWTRFRGPNGTGLSAAKTIPTAWTEKDFNWRIPLPGKGHSSPVVWGDRIFLTTGDDKAGQVLVLCLHADDGRIAWQRSFAVSAYHKNDLNSLTSGSPTVDAERVYVCWTTPTRFTLMALTHEGKTVWEKDLGPYASQHGGGASPVLYEDKVVLGNEQDGASFLIAADAATGQTRWQTPRKTTQAAYGTPCVYQPKQGKPELIFSSQSHGLSAIDPETGKLLWEMPELFDKRTVSSPVLAGELILGACGNGGGENYLVAVRPGGSDAKPERAYTIRKAAPYVPTSIAVGNLVFLWSDAGAVTCLETSTGAVKWQERVGGNYFSSPVSADGRIFCVSKTGEVVVVEASNRFKLLARNRLNETTHSTPAIAGGRMYIHTISSLVSVGGRALP